MPKQALDHSDRRRERAERPAPGSLPYSIRHLRTHEEFVACVDLQHEVWGANFSERVPAALLKVGQRIGGIAAGAFDADDRIIGFVFGLTGVENGELVHWSDMLAVRADLRDHGIGSRLKEFQREALLRLGVTRIYWTFDPLVARNAHLNFNHLGVQVVEYVIDMYGSETSSALHRGLGTDRFIVVRQIAERGPRARADGHAAPSAAAAHAARILNPIDGDGAPTMPELPTAPLPALLRVAIPLEIDHVQAVSLPTAARWRATTRRAILWGIEHGYRVSSFYRDDTDGCGYYVLSAPSPARDHA